MKLFDQIEQICRERGIDREVLVDTIEAAMKAAAKKVFGEQREIEADFNEETGAVDLLFILIVSDEEEVENPQREITLEQARKYADPHAEPGDELLFPIFYREEDIEQAKEQDRRFGDILQLETSKHAFGRIAAQTAKQVINQRLREAERQNIYKEFKDRKNELITGIFRRYDRGNMLIDLGRTDGILYHDQLPRRESYRPNDRVLAYVLDVQRSARDAQVILSRTDPGLVIKLFEHEVPEIQEGIVKIVAVAREAGVRSKVAVYSTDTDVDPVGACVGMRGTRVQSIVQELRGEKIDIVPYNTDPARFVCSAINPAQVSKVFIDETRKAMELIVPDDQLSLAIGRGGQNVRLATQLTGWNLEILSETRLDEMKLDSKQRLMTYQGVTEALVDTLFLHGYNRLEDIAVADIEDVILLPGFDEDIADNMIAAAIDILEGGADSDDDIVTEADLERQALMKIHGVSEKMATQLYNAGYISPLFVVAETDAEQLATLTDLDLKKCEQIIAASDEWYEKQEFSEEEIEEHKEQFEFIRQEFSVMAEEVLRSKQEAEENDEDPSSDTDEAPAEDAENADDAETSEEPAAEAESSEDEDNDADAENEEA